LPVPKVGVSALPVEEGKDDEQQECHHSWDDHNSCQHAVHQGFSRACGGDRRAIQRRRGCRYRRSADPLNQLDCGRYKAKVTTSCGAWAWHLSASRSAFPLPPLSCRLLPWSPSRSEEHTSELQS